MCFWHEYRQSIERSHKVEPISNCIHKVFSFHCYNTGVPPTVVSPWMEKCLISGHPTGTSISLTNTPNWGEGGKGCSRFRTHDHWPKSSFTTKIPNRTGGRNDFKTAIWRQTATSSSKLELLREIFYKLHVVLYFTNLTFQSKYETI